jgi:hypothetical protein
MSRFMSLPPKAVDRGARSGLHLPDGAGGQVGIASALFVDVEGVRCIVVVVMQWLSECFWQSEELMIVIDCVLR